MKINLKKLAKRINKVYYDYAYTDKYDNTTLGEAIAGIVQEGIPKFKEHNSKYAYSIGVTDGYNWAIKDIIKNLEREIK